VRPHISTLSFREKQSMMNRTITETIAAELQIFQTVNQKENFLFIIGALLTQVISLQKAAEVMEMEPEMILQLLELMGIEFSYLSDDDVCIERTWQLS
jgi:predicted HTH domain antitoxin